MLAVPDVDRSMSPGDGWALRIAVFIYGLYSASILVKGLSQKLKKADGTRDGCVIIWKLRLFIVLGVLGLYCILLFMLHTILDTPSGTFRSWICMLSIGHAVYCATETQISFTRMPKMVLGIRGYTVLTVIVKCGISVAIVRTGVNIVNIACWFGGNLENPQSTKCVSIDLATTVFNIGGSAFFFLTELYVYYLTVRISHMTMNQTTIRTMNLLSKANVYGSLAGLVDIANSFYQLQTLEAIVLGLGMTAFIYYGSLLRLDGSMARSEDTLVATHTSSTRENTYIKRIPSSPTADPAHNNQPAVPLKVASSFKPV